MFRKRGINILQSYVRKYVTTIGCNKLINHRRSGEYVVARSSHYKMSSASTTSGLRDIAQTNNSIALSPFTSNSDERANVYSLQDMVHENFNSMDAHDYLESTISVLRTLTIELWRFHYRGELHKNLMPRNVLLCNAKWMLPSLDNDDADSFGWKAPEELRSKTKTKASDMFSLGCIFYFCITGGSHPFGDDTVQRRTNIKKNKANLSGVEGIPEAFHIISLLLSKKPELRPNVMEVLGHPLLENLDWKFSLAYQVCSFKDDYPDLNEQLCSKEPLLKDPNGCGSFMESLMYILMVKDHPGVTAKMQRSYLSRRPPGLVSRIVLHTYKYMWAHCNGGDPLFREFCKKKIACTGGASNRLRDKI